MDSFGSGSRCQNTKQCPATFTASSSSTAPIFGKPIHASQHTTCVRGRLLAKFRGNMPVWIATFLSSGRFRQYRNSNYVGHCIFYKRLGALRRAGNRRQTRANEGYRQYGAFQLVYLLSVSVDRRISHLPTGADRVQEDK